MATTKAAEVPKIEDHIQKRPTIHGDSSRGLTVELPPTYDHLLQLVLSSFAMDQPVRVYRNGKILVDRDNYDDIVGGDTLVVVDAGGRAVDLRDLFTTTYDREFKAKALPPREPMAAAEPYSPSKDNRDFKSVTARDFQKWPLEKRAPPGEPLPAPKSLPFNATTTNMDTYKAYEIKPQKMAPPVKYDAPSVPFNATTTNQDTFKRWPLEKRAPPGEPLPAPKSLPFNATTTNMDTYKAYEIKPQKMAPPAPYEPANIPFKGTTTSHDAYRRWSIPKKVYVNIVPANDAYISRETGETLGEYLKS